MYATVFSVGPCQLCAIYSWDALGPYRCREVLPSCFPRTLFNMLKGENRGPLQTSDVSTILDQFQEKFGEKQNVILSFCFTHQFTESEKNKESCPTWLFKTDESGQRSWDWTLPQAFSGRDKDDIKHDLLRGQYLAAKEEKVIDQWLNTQGKTDETHVANYNMFYWCGNPIAVYRKGCYVSEVADEKCDNCVYEIGDWRTKILDGPGSGLAIALFGGDKPLLGVRICGDWCVADACAQNSELNPNVHKIFKTQFAQAKFILKPSDGAPLGEVAREGTELFKKLSSKETLIIIVDNTVGQWASHFLYFSGPGGRYQKTPYVESVPNFDITEFSISNAKSTVSGKGLPIKCHTEKEEEKR